MQVVLTHLEVTGVQEYIFGSNHLRQNIGASELVARSTTEWVVQALKECSNHNVSWNGIDIQFDQRGTTDTDVNAYVVYAGSGVALILFKGEVSDSALSNARRFCQRLTERLLREAEGLSLIVVHSRPFDWTQASLASIHKELRQQAARRKRSQSAHSLPAGLAVTAACEFTGQPAVAIDQEGRFIAASIQHRLAAEEQATARLHQVLPQVSHEGFTFIRDFDQFGERGEQRYLAVVHIDGNRMGERFAAIADFHSNPGDNETYIARLRLLSQAIKECSSRALQSTVTLLIENMRGKRNKHLPFRPVVFGGDDVTFVCDGRFGLSLCAHFLRRLTDESLPGPRDDQPGEPLYVGAGVAIVRSHYPFSRAYQLAKDLTRSAKRRLSEWNIANSSTMDWHVSTTGAVLSLENIRLREYRSRDGNSLLMRPLLVVRDRNIPMQSRYWRSWETFESLFSAFKQEWGDRRNKIKALRDALREGPAAVELFRLNYDQPELPPIPGMSRDFQRTGWSGNECGYYDVIEMLDLHEPLSQSQTGS